MKLTEGSHERAFDMPENVRQRVRGDATGTGRHGRPKGNAGNVSAGYEQRGHFGKKSEYVKPAAEQNKTSKRQKESV